MKIHLRSIDEAIALANRHFEASIRAFQTRVLASDEDGWIDVDDVDDAVRHMREEFDEWKQKLRAGDLEALQESSKTAT